ncbi:Nramp family divalent metal transporter [Streptomyces sp. CSDS2]|uniref:Nramp family divalent metal transporter n=1 Tax=Streptomyces sp. CSDS2 TaxID=3055051 RepID=UPI0025B0DB97|nr:Nramp family divalent metal transporter [Streptomyces sp. CSDS2]MDN3265290.1 Nramp family divalent metal transporter [Streptomyces sp. CSDS2]
MPQSSVDHRAGAAPAPPRSLPSRFGRAYAVLGSAFVVAVAYVDPGNFATNMTGGARYGSLLLWVIGSASLAAVFVQYLAAKLGIATGRNLPELCREHYPRPVTLGLWIQAELVGMATDLAEFVGAAVALNLLFGIPLLPAALITAAVSLAILTLAPLRRRRFETVIVALILLVSAGFAYQVFRSGPPPAAGAGLIPGFAGTDSVLLATGMLGATVMPHAVYLHSALTQGQYRASVTARRKALRSCVKGLVCALGIAAVINGSMLLVAAASLHGTSLPHESLADIHGGLGRVLGGDTALAFALALLASGIAASSVGTYAGQVIMSGFLRTRIPLVLRRLLTMTPPLAILALGTDPTQALIISQVVLSFGIPFALVPLVLFGRRRDVMGPLTNRRRTTVTGTVMALSISGLNLFLLQQLLG